IPSTDFEHLGYETALQSRDQAAAEQICGLHIHAFADELHPEISDLDRGINTNLGRTRALHSHLYDRPLPVSDAAMLARDHTVPILITLGAIAGVASIISHSMTFYLMGMGILALVIGVGMTGVAVVAGHQLFESMLVQHKQLKALTVALVAGLCFWGLLEIAMTRTRLLEKSASSDAANGAESFVDSAPNSEVISESSASEPQSSEEATRDKLG